MTIKDHPKDDDQRAVHIENATCQQLREQMVQHAVRDTDLLFTSTVGTPLSRNNFRTKYWAPAVKTAKLDQTVTFHNLRAAHASWLLAPAAPTSPSFGNAWGTAKSPPRSSISGPFPMRANVLLPRIEGSATPADSRGRRRRYGVLCRSPAHRHRATRHGFACSPPSRDEEVAPWTRTSAGGWPLVILESYEHRGDPEDDVPLAPRDHRRQNVRRWR
jgi:hypothetical protein